MKEFLQAIGKTGSINLQGLIVHVVIKDVKESWGKTRYLVTPSAGGEGEIWVEKVFIFTKGDTELLRLRCAFCRKEGKGFIAWNCGYSGVCSECIEEFGKRVKELKTRA